MGALHNRCSEIANAFSEAVQAGSERAAREMLANDFVDDDRRATVNVGVRSPAATARSASSSATSGTPNSAMTPSPWNLATVPWCWSTTRCTMS